MKLMEVEYLQPATIRTEADIVSTQKTNWCNGKAAAGRAVGQSSPALAMYNVGLNYAGVSIKHVTFYQDFIVWQYFTPSFSGHYPSKTNKQKQFF